jgi:hypothetical protein
VTTAMSTEIAPIGAWRLELAKMRTFVLEASTSAEEISDARKQAEQLRKVALIAENAHEVARDALRIEFTALRKLVQMDALKLIPAMTRTSAQWLAGLSQGEFDGLLDRMGAGDTPVAVYRRVLAQQESARSRQRGEDIGNGRGDQGEYRSAAEAAYDLLHSAAAGGATTVDQLADRLRTEFGIGDLNWESDSLLREGVETVVREALRQEAVKGGEHPDWLTWRDADLGWLRIPWGAGSLTQLRWMAEFRAQQAKEVQAAADELGALAEHLTLVQQRHPEMDKLTDLWANRLPQRQ